MKIELEKLEDLSGKQASIYSVKLDDDDLNLFEHFMEENDELYSDEIDDIYLTLEDIGSDTGAREQLFKHESSPPDGVGALYDKKRAKLRLYCIRYGNDIVILGNGGRKTTRTYQEDPKLNGHVELMAKISDGIKENITSKLSNNRLVFEGSLTFNISNDE